MSKLRNTPSAPRRGRHTVLASAAVAGALAATLLAACSSDAHNPVAPAAAVTAAAPHAYGGTTAAPYMPVDAQWALGAAQFYSMVSTWRTQSSDVQVGTRVPEPLQCSGVMQGTMVTTVRPSTTTQRVQVGRAVLTIPGGAVPTSFTLAATASLNQNSVSFDFQPHGYKFAKAIQIDVNYEGCTPRYSSPLNFFYTNDTDGILQTMPSTDDRTNTTIHALTDHFSHYMVAWT